MKADHRATLTRRQIFSPGLFSVTFDCPDLASTVLPGQFAMLEVPERVQPYLRRAYSVADADAAAGTVEFLIKTIGRGTRALEQMPERSAVRLLGPMGNAFTVTGLPRGARVVIVAGGIGAAPFPALLRAIVKAGLCADFYLGGRNARELSIRARFDATAGLDPIAASEFDLLLHDLQRTLGLTVFMVTHDLDSLFALANRVAVLIDGRLKLGTLAEMLTDTDPWIKRYFSGPRGRAAQFPRDVGNGDG